jgi:hypothetical protein
MNQDQKNAIDAAIDQLMQAEQAYAAAQASIAPAKNALDAARSAADAAYKNGKDW